MARCAQLKCLIPSALAAVRLVGMPTSCDAAVCVELQQNALIAQAAAGADDFCRLSNNATIGAEPAVFAKRVKYIESGNERAVMEALAKHGPLSIGIDADCVPFRFYTSGIVNTTECTSDPDNIDHAVMLVGYGSKHGAPLFTLPLPDC